MNQSPWRWLKVKRKEKLRITKKNQEKLGKNTQKQGETKKLETRRNKNKKEREETKLRRIHMPKIQHSTTQIFYKIYKISSFFTNHWDKNKLIKILQ